MPTFVDGPGLAEKLSAAYRKHGGARLAVAFWGDGAADILTTGRADDVRIVCNLSLGGTNPDAIRSLIEQGAEVKHLPGLHAKLGVVGDRSFVGSSNFSHNGLGGGHSPSLVEFNAVFEGERREIVDQFDRIWEDASAVDDTILKLAKDRWRRQEGAPEAAGERQLEGSSLVQTILDHPHCLDGAGAHFAIYAEVSDKENEMIDRADQLATKTNGAPCGCYWDWSGLPEEGYILDIRRPPRGPWAVVGWYRRVRELKDFNMEDETFSPSFESSGPLGIELSRDEEQRLKNAVRRYLKDGHPLDNDGAVCAPLSDLRPYLMEDRN